MARAAGGQLGVLALAEQGPDLVRFEQGLAGLRQVADPLVNPFVMTAEKDDILFG